MPRQWGFWTRGKLDILRDYLDAFTTTTKYKARRRLYLDLFAGGPDNFDRDTGERLEGSAEIALSTTDPPFTAIRLFELNHAEQLEPFLRAKFPESDLRVYAGDCNETIHGALDDLARLGLDRVPAFAFIDPNGPHYSWSTLEALARFKPASMTKVELWMLLPVDMFVRFLRTDGGEVDAAHERSVTDMYGTEDWRYIYRARLLDKLAPAQARSEYVNLMRWRLQHVLGYRWTHALEVHNEQDRPIYHLLFATDHEAGNKIMVYLYGRALKEFPRMRKEAIDQRRGAARLFDAEYIDRDLRYDPEPAWEPYGRSAR